MKISKTKEKKNKNKKKKTIYFGVKSTLWPKPVFKSVWVTGLSEN